MHGEAYQIVFSVPFCLSAQLVSSVMEQANVVLWIVIITDHCHAHVHKVAISYSYGKQMDSNGKLVSE